MTNHIQFEQLCLPGFPSTIVVNHHILKCWRPFWEAIRAGTKMFEVRYDDRGYKVGDYLHLMCVDPEFPNMVNPKPPTIVVQVTSILKGEEWGIKRGYSVLGIKLSS